MNELKKDKKNEPFEGKFSVSCSTGMLDSARYPSVGRIRVTVNVDLNDGSSKHGKAFLASVGWNLDVAMGIFSPFSFL